MSSAFSNTYAYPFCALSVSGTPVVAQLGHLDADASSAASAAAAAAAAAQQRNAHHTHLLHHTVSAAAAAHGAGATVAGGGGSSAKIEPKPLLSAQYEGISDED